MAKYTSRFKELAFYVNGERKQFTNGAYVSTNKAEDSVLVTLSDVIKEVEKETPAKAVTKAEAKSSTKAKSVAPRKPAAKK